MKGTCILLLLLYRVIGLNCAEIFVPRFTVDNADKESSEDKFTHTVAGTNVDSSIDGSDPTDETGFIGQFLSSALRRWFNNALTTPWYKGENVCKKENFTVQELNDTRAHVDRFISVRRCFEEDGKYTCVTTNNNGTHETHKFEEFTCSPGYVLDDDGVQCKAVVVQKLSDVLTANKANKFEKYLEQRNLDGHTIFVFPDDESPLDDETVRAHIAKELVHLKNTDDGKRILTDKGSTIVLTSQLEDDKFVYRANCEKLLSTNNYVSNDTIVHVAAKKLPTASLSTMEYISSNPHLSIVRDIIDFAIVNSPDAELFDITERPLYTVFIPTNDAIQKQLDRWPGIRKKRELLRLLIAYYMFDNMAICASAGKSSPFPIKAVEINGTEVFKFGDTLISQANIVTKNGIVHILKEVGELPMEFQPLEKVLEDMKMFEFLKAYNKLKEEWQEDDDYELGVFLPSEAGSLFTDEEIRRHVLRSNNGSILVNNDPFRKANIYAHINTPGSIIEQLTLNCVPISSSQPMKFGEGYIFKTNRKIPEGFPDIFDALHSTKQHNLFSKLLKQYFKKHSNQSEITVLALEDSVLLNCSDSIPKSVSGFLGTGEISDEDSKDLDEFMSDFILDQELCHDSLAYIGFLHAISGKSYQVKRTENVTLVGGARIVASDMVTSNGIVHSLSALPKAHDGNASSTWLVLSNFGWLSDLLFS